MQKVEQQTANKAAYNGDIPNTPVRFILHVSRPYAVWASLGIALSLTAASVEIASVLILQAFVNSAESHDSANAIFYGLAFPISVLVVQLTWRLSGLAGRVWVIR